MSGFEQFIQERIYLQNVSPKNRRPVSANFQVAGKILPHGAGSKRAYRRNASSGFAGNFLQQSDTLR
jgi:hypothetical protein